MKKIFSAMLMLSMLFSCASMGACVRVNNEVDQEQEEHIMEINITDDSNIEKVVTTSNFEIKDVPENRNMFSFPAYYDDDMLFQANKAVKFVGESSVNGPLAVVVNDTAYYTTVVENKFEMYIGKVDYTTSTDLVVVNEQGKYTFSNVAFGELYLASGQSNMEFTMDWTQIYKDEINSSANSNIRLINVHNNHLDAPLDNFYGDGVSGWMEASPNIVNRFSATAYFFAKELNALYNVPVGIISAPEGGTVTHTWMDAETFDKCSKLEYLPDLPYERGKASVHYNAMIYPLRDMSLRGVIWYQGESESLHNDLELNTKLVIESWRKTFDDEDLFFATAQLPRYAWQNYFDKREDQKNAVIDDPYATYSVNIDLGETLFEANQRDASDGGIHPPKKLDFGMRLAHSVVEKLYKAEGVWRGPALKNVTLLETNEVVLNFSNVADGLKMTNTNGFEVILADNSRHFASPTIIDNDSIQLKVDSDLAIKTVIYGYSDYGTNYNEATLTTFKNSVGIYNSKDYPLEQFFYQIY